MGLGPTYPRHKNPPTQGMAMAKRVIVSSAQKSAAKAMVSRSAVTGRNVSSSVRKIADAKTLPSNKK
ncbi:hypothetical protein GCM10028771_17970 [Nocardioides marmoraquaticus]